MLFNQSRVLVLFAIAAGLAIAYFNSKSQDNNDTNKSIETKDNSSAFLTESKITNFDKEGNPIFLSSPESKLYADGSIEINEPNIRLLTSKNEEIHAKARKGILSEKQDTLRLIDNVEINQERGNGTPLRLSSDEFYIDNYNKIISTEAKVFLSFGNNTLESIGMEASLENKELILKQKVRGSYVFTD